MRGTTRGRIVVLVLAASLGIAQLSTATDLPLSWRGQPGSTYQEWLFNGKQNPAPSDASRNATAVSAVVKPGEFGTGWVQELDGAWDLGRTGTIQIPLPGLCKHVSVQVDQMMDGSIYSTLAGVSVSGALAMASSSKEVSLGTLAGWTASQTVYELDPSTPSAPLVITGANDGSVITRVLVETLPGDPTTTGVQLTIRRLAGSQVEVSWPLVEGTVLEGCSSLGSSWTELDVTPVRGAERFSVTLDLAGNMQFLRVRQP